MQNVKKLRITEEGFLLAHVSPSRVNSPFTRSQFHLPPGRVLLKVGWVGTLRCSMHTLRSGAVGRPPRV